MSVPLSYYNLDDNILVQKICFFIFYLILLEWCIYYMFVGLDFSRIPVIGKNQSQVIGSVIFNYAFVVTIPSWVNEKKN